jgi:hypothetical protein
MSPVRSSAASYAKTHASKWRRSAHRDGRTLEPRPRGGASDESLDRDVADRVLKSEDLVDGRDRGRRARRRHSRAAVGRRHRDASVTIAAHATTVPPPQSTAPRGAGADN